MTKQIKNMNKDELIEIFKKLNAMQEDLRQIYEKEFGYRVGEEISNDIEIESFNQIQNNLYGIILAKHDITKRLSSEFDIFVM